MNQSLKNKLVALSLSTAITLISTAPAFTEETNNFSYGSQIVDVTEAGNIAALESLLAQGANPNEMGEFDTTPLMRAAYHGNKELVAILLKSGAKPDMRDLGGACALTIAARENYPDVVRALIKAGANPNLATNDGYTPLAIAKSKKNSEVASILSDAGGNSTAQQVAQIKPASGNEKTDAKKSIEVANADINVDMSNGRLDGLTKPMPMPTQTQVAKVEPQKTIEVAKDSPPVISLASFQVVNKVDTTAKPEIALTVITPKAEKSEAANADKAETTNVADSTWVKTALKDNKTYQLSADQVVSNANQNSTLNLGTFKSQEFAQNKINELKASYGPALSGVELKVVGKAMGPATTYQVIGGLVSNSKANDICGKLIASGANCRVESSSFASQSQFSQYNGTVAAPAAVASAPTEKQDLLGPAKSPEVASKTLPSIADATKPQAPAPAVPLPVVQAKPMVVADNNLPVPPAAKTLAPNSDDAKTDRLMAQADQQLAPKTLPPVQNVGSFAQDPAPVAAQSAPITQAMPLPLPTPTDLPPVNTVASSQNSNSSFASVDNMMNSRNSDSTTVAPVQKAQPMPNIAATGNPITVAPVPMPMNRSAHIQPVITTPNALVPQPAVPTNTVQAQPTVIQHVPTAALATATPAVSQPQVTAQASNSLPTPQYKPATNPTTPAPNALSPAYVPSPQVIVHSKNRPAFVPPPQNYASTTKSTPPAPVAARPVQTNKFEVSRPVKVTDNQPSYAENNTAYVAPQSDNFSNREIWVKVDYFVNENAARYYLDSLRAQDPSLNAYRIRTTHPLTGSKASAQIGPFASNEAADGVCRMVNAQNQGYRCAATENFIPSYNYQGDYSTMRHSSIYGSESPASYERHSSALSDNY